LNKARSLPLPKKPSVDALPKARTGISGLDEITFGGLPRGRPTLVCGGAGSGKTLLAMEFLLRGAMQFSEPGVYMSFEENPDELAQNVRSLGFDLGKLIEQNKIAVDYVHVERSEIEETGEYDLEGLFLRLGAAIDAVGAKRVALDTLESLFSGFDNPIVLRSELRRLFRWLKDRGVTAVITGERGDGALTPRARGIRLRLRDPARSPRQRPGVDAAAAHRQVPRHDARHQRISLPD
jgi:circadian clock protein KaiC